MPIKWTDEQKAKACEEILARVRGGQSLLAACTNGDDWTPTESTFRDWCKADPDLAANYACAREDRADVIFEEMIEIADNASNDWMERQGEKSAGWVLNGDHVQRSRLMIDTRKWMLAKMQPKKYGEKLAIGGADDLPPIKTINAEALSDAALAEILAAINAEPDAS